MTKKHLLDHNRTYYELLRQITAAGQETGQFNASLSVSKMVKLYALSERALLYDRFLCGGEYSLRQYSASVMPGFLSYLLYFLHFLLYLTYYSLVFSLYSVLYCVLVCLML